MKFIMDFLRKDIWRKLIALTIATVLYLNMYEQKEQILRDIPVEIQHDREIFIAPADRKQKVSISVRGSERLLKKLRNEGISGKVVLTNTVNALRFGKADIQLSDQNFGRLRGMKITDINPQNLSIPIQRQISKSVKIEPVISGNAAPGKVITAVRCFPNIITVEGPENQLDSLSAVRTENLAIDGESIDFSKTVKLINPDKGTFTFSNSKCNISVEIRESTEISSKIHDVPVRYMFSPLRNFSDKDVALPHPAKVTVTLRGSQSVINHISKDKITVFADLSNITVPGQYNVPLKVNIAEKEDGIKNITVKPEKVKVIISASPNN